MGGRGGFEQVFFYIQARGTVQPVKLLFRRSCCIHTEPPPFPFSHVQYERVSVLVFYGPSDFLGVFMFALNVPVLLLPWSLRALWLQSQQVAPPRGRPLRRLSPPLLETPGPRRGVQAFVAPAPGQASLCRYRRVRSAWGFVFIFPGSVAVFFFTTGVRVLRTDVSPTDGAPWRCNGDFCSGQWQ